ncbi:hypothetical protein GCM10009664_63040 [Kitasatospora gansuensis]
MLTPPAVPNAEFSPIAASPHGSRAVAASPSSITVISATPSDNATNAPVNETQRTRSDFHAILDILMPRANRAGPARSPARAPPSEVEPALPPAPNPPPRVARYESPTLRRWRRWRRPGWP